MLPSSDVDAVNTYVTLSGLDPVIGVNERCQIAYRIEVRNEVIYSSQYGRVTNRKSHTICYKSIDNDVCYGSVQYFILANETVLVVMHPMRISALTYQQEFHLSSATLNSVTGAAKAGGDADSSTVVVTCVECIQHKCLLIDVGSVNKYVVSFPNSLHLD